jgi:hypothetical protein
VETAARLLRTRNAIRACLASLARQVAYRELASHLDLAGYEDLFEAVLPTDRTT